MRLPGPQMRSNDRMLSLPMIREETADSEQIARHILCPYTISPYTKLQRWCRRRFSFRPSIAGVEAGSAPAGSYLRSEVLVQDFRLKTTVLRKLTEEREAQFSRRLNGDSDTATNQLGNRVTCRGRGSARTRTTLCPVG
jgi:hypothetical protein